MTGKDLISCPAWEAKWGWFRGHLCNCHCALRPANFGGRALEFHCLNIDSVRIIVSFHYLLQLSSPFTLSASLNICISLFSFFALTCSILFALQHFDSPLQRGLVRPSRLWSRAHRRSFHRRQMRGTRRTGGTGWEEHAAWPVWTHKVHKTTHF